MSTQIVTGYYSSLFDLDSPGTTLSITASGYLFGGLLGGSGQYLVINQGGIYGVSLSDDSTLDNLGTIRTTYRYGAAVALGGGGELVNGSTSDTSALIVGGTAPVNRYFQEVIDLAVYIGGGSGMVINYGTIETRPNGDGLFLGGGGDVTNGAPADHVALITSSKAAVQSYAAVTLTNFGTISSTSGVAILDGNGGVVVNGSDTDTSALISGGVTQYYGEVTNDGSIVATSSDLYQDIGVAMNGGVVTNGSAADTAASITGYKAVEFYALAGTVTNDGTLVGGASPEVRGKTPSGVFLYGGGLVTNGAANDTKALIEGYDGITAFARASATVKNFGTILGGSTYFSVAVQLGVGTFVNGSASDLTATIEAYTGLSQGRYGYSLGAQDSHPGALTASNFGTIIGYGFGLGQVGLGAYLYTSGSRLTNGSATDHTALITGVDGVELAAGCTLTNFAVIQGTGSAAVELDTASARLNAEAGSAFEGTVAAGAGLVDVVGGTSAMTGLFSVGEVEGAGTLSLAGGASSFGTGAKLLVAAIDVSGAATSVTIGGKLADAKLWDQTGGTLTIGSGYSIKFTGAGDTFAGTVAGAGLVAFGGGSDLLSAVTLDAAKFSISKAAVTLSGPIDLVTDLSDAGAAITIAQAGASLTGGGTVSLSDSDLNIIEGATATTRLTDVSDLIEGAGQLGEGELEIVLDAGATVKSDASAALIIDTTGALDNAGLVVADSTGGLTIDGAVANTGTLEAVKGTLTVGGAVSGSGVARIAGGEAAFDATFSQNVTFTSAGGTLALARSRSYAGTISGFAIGGGTTLDLEDIVFGAKTKATYSGTASGGVLTVTDGTHTATIALTGDYAGAAFTAVSDGDGGSDITAISSPAPHAAPLATAMATFGPAAGGSGAVATTHAPPTQILAAPVGRLTG